MSIWTNGETRPKLTKVAADIDSINTNLAEISANLERITASLAALTEMAEATASKLQSAGRLFTNLPVVRNIL